MKSEEDQKQKWRAEIDANESIQKYFSQFSSASVENFIDHLLRNKNMWMQYGHTYTDRMETDGVQWVYSAFSHLQTIQQKKLFDVQCLWRAEKLAIKEIELCCDFKVWEQDILNCPFIDPVSQEDIELYIAYLQQENKDEPGWLESWQDYFEIKEAYNTGNESGDFPDWYDFYNGRKGTGVLMTLPDTRGDKEEFYKDILRQFDNEKNAAKNEEWERTHDKRPYLQSYDKKQMDWFVHTFENKEAQQLYKSFEWGHRNREKEEIMEQDLELLFSATEDVPIAAHHNWMEAVQLAAEKYRVKKITEAIPEAWEQYMINIQTGIAFQPNGSSYQWLKDLESKNILEGRALNGEPADLNF